MKFKIPKNIDDHPTVAAYAARRAALAAERTDLMQEKLAISARLREAKESKAGHTFEQYSDPLQRRAAEIAFGSTEVPNETDTERLAVIEPRLRELDIALAMMYSKIQQLRGQASREICEGLAEQHTAIEKAFARTMADATSAALDYHRLVTQLEDAGIQTTSMDLNLPFFLRARDRYDVLAQWFRKSVERGTLPMADVPAHFDWTK